MATYRATVQIVHFERDEHDTRFSHNMPLSEPWNIVFKTWKLFDVGQNAYELAAT